ncbi:MAG: glycoside hydrolase family 31 protein [Coriobacteriaceae bacterium]|nr:glycoside hydrolase family 31 protein [Coriobacteriaceae bacterium]
MHQDSILKRNWVRGSAVIATAALSLALAAPASAAPLTSVKSATADKNVVTVTFNDGQKDIQGKITFLEDDIFRYNVDPKGEFNPYAVPMSKDHVAKIQAQPDSSDVYSHPDAKVEDKGGKIIITSGDTTIEFAKDTALMTVKKGNTVVMEEASALDLSGSATVQTLKKHEGEDFFGGGTQNGRFIHTGNTINIANESSWTDGGVSSPNPFYWSDAGYGVLRNTFQTGSYDFGATNGELTTALHNEGELDAYYFVADAASGKSTAPIAQDLLQGYFKVTGNPVLLPEYAFYVGHLNAWNRDMWSKDAQQGYGKWQIKGGADSKDANAGDIEYEKGGTGTEVAAGTTLETLNGTGPTVATKNMPEGVKFDREFSAQDRLDSYLENDMPLGYFLPNDGYGAGYGQNGYKMTGGVNPDGSSSAERLAAVDANVKNLQEFTEYANKKGVHTGLWTQSQITPDSNPDTPWQLLRDFKKEVEVGGITTLKTDVAWVGPGYSFALNGTKTAYDIATNPTNKDGFRPNIITLDGWAGTQRYAGIWTGDQSGGNWEYIRFHVPTYIGQSLSGNPNIGSDMDGIWGGNPVIATRDYQWKSFAPLMLDMDGWGSYVKAPQTHGDPYTGISRMYLKLKSSLMPYIYTTAASAANLNTGNNDEGLPIVRAILLSDDSAYAQSTATQYEYTLGEDILVAPIVANTDGDESNGGVGDGDDIRNGIYLPGDENTIWVDYFTGKQYRGGQVLNHFDAPLWKLPVFIKANAIIPMYEPNNNPQDIDRSKRNVEFFATTGENSYTQYEDDGIFVDSDLKESKDKDYGTENKVNYGGHVSTTYNSKVSDKTATFTAEKSTGTYKGYNAEHTTTFIVNASAKPKTVVAKNGTTTLKMKEVDSQEAFDKATPADGEFIYFYNTKPNLNYGASSEATDAVKKEGFSSKEIITTPKVYVKFAKTDVQKNVQTLELTGFENEGNLDANVENAKLKVPTLKTPTEENGDLTPTSFRLSWDKIEGATSYELMIDGTINSVPAGTPEAPITSLNVTEQAYNSTHTVKIRQRTAEGFSKWSNEITVVTLKDPWRNTPTPVSAEFAGGVWANSSAYVEMQAFNHSFVDGKMFHSGNDKAEGQAMTVDYGKAYKFDKLGYWPRTDLKPEQTVCSGTVLKMKVETSLDGVHWVDCGTSNWENTPEPKEFQFEKPVFGRYVRLTPVDTNNGYFTALELSMYKVDGSSAFEVGSIAGDGKVTDSDYQHLTGNCKGRENREPLKDQWSHVANCGADFNFNEAYDAYDMAFTMSKLDGGTTKTDKASGNIVVVPSKGEVKAGDVITVDLYADDIKNANALGALIHFQNDQFEFVKDSLTKSPYTATMEDLSVVHTDFTDGKQSVNISFQNKGDKDLYSGSGAVASFKLKALKDGKVALPSTAWAIGAQLDYIETVDNGEITYPETPQPETGELGKGDFNLTMTNEALPKDDGSNVGKMTQAGKYDPLFDGVEFHDGGMGAGVFEFKWGATSDEVSLPVELHFDLKNNRVLDNVEIVNRKDGAGTVGGNGFIKKLEATMVFEDGTKQSFKGGEFDTIKSVYTLTPSAENAGKKVDRVDVKVLEANKGPHMLTISEINFNYTNPVEQVESVVLGDNATSLFVGELSEVKASVTPESLNYNQFEVTSSNPEVAGIVTKQVGENVANFVRGNKPGKATITVKSMLDKTKTASYEVTIKDGVNTSALEAALAEARSLNAAAYTEASYAKLAEAVKAGEELLQSGKYTDKQIADATVAIRTAIKGLEALPIDESKLINTEEHKDIVKISGFSSQCEPQTLEDGLATNSLDYNDQSYWHSNYSTSLGMPQYLEFDLGASYDLSGMKFLPRQNGQNGDIFEARIYVADTAEGLKTALPVGTFKFENNGTTLTARDEFKSMGFGATGRFVKFEIVHSGGDAADQYASLSEVRFYGTESEQTPQADVTELKALVEKIEAENLKAEDYTKESWTKFDLALKDAKATLKDPQATQAEVDSQRDALKKAYDGLVKTEVPPAEKPSKADLENLVSKAEGLDTTGKTPESIQALKDAIANAKNVLAKDDASKEEIKSAYDALASAIDGLKDVEQGGGNQGGGDSGNQGGGSGNQGGSTGSGSNGSGLPQTGDPVTMAVAGTGLIGSVTAALGAMFRRKNRK